MNYLDIVLGIFLLLGLYKGIKNGFLVEVASLLALILGVYGAIHFSNYAFEYLSHRLNWQPTTLNLLAFAVTFLVIVALVMLLGKLLTKLANFVMLGILNKILGGIFGVLKTAFILSVILLFVNSITSRIQLIDQKTKDASQLFSLIAPIAPWLLPNVLEEYENIKDEEGTDPLEALKTQTG